jgi:hypothetical protein
MADARGINGRHGFIRYPGMAECGDDFDTWAAKMLNAQSGSVVAPDNSAANARMLQEHAAREARIGARDIAVAYAAGVAQQLRAPGKMFSREVVCAIIRAQRTQPQTEESVSALNRLLTIFENLE